ncbi:GPI transamidase component PIG-S-like isoform X2 [Lineus longissimus]
MVYRVSLPYSEISDLSHRFVVYSVHIHVISLDDSIEKGHLTALGESLGHALNRLGTGGSGLEAKYHSSARPAHDDEKQDYVHARTVADFDDKLAYSNVLGEHGKFYMYILPKKSHLDVGKGFVGRRRNSYFKTEDFSSLTVKITKLIKEVFVREETIARAYKSEKGVLHLKTDKDSMRATKSNPNYDVTFTMLNPQPDIMDVRWAVQQEIDTYMGPFIKTLSDFIGITIKSQILHYTQVTFRPHRDDGKGEYYLKQDDIPGLINPIEREITSFVSNNPNINFVIYIPTRSKSPLYFRDQKGKNLPTNAILSPRWGGLIIKNIPSPSNTTKLPALVNLDMKEILDICISQLRLLLGIETSYPNLDVTFQEPDNTGIALWELDFWLRKRAIENTALATSTLSSLSDLLGQISNIVINDDIGEEVATAVHSIENSLEFLKENKLRDGFLTSRQATLASEKAFFDESLLELLYFPDDQKFAIYIPLFLPISLPVIMTMLQAIKWMRGEKKNKTE